MYFFFGILLLLCVLFFLLGFWRRRRIIGKICRMKPSEKICLLNELAAPLGYSYLPKQDVMTSRIDAWQRDFGYCALYDQAAPYFQMVFDCEPIYFDYEDRTWLIELWKGQYGINTGAEIGVYQADRLLSPEEYASASFRAVPDSGMLPLSMDLYRNDVHLFSVKQVHWWLTGFCMGAYSRPEELSMRAAITFPDFRMQESFLHALGRENCPCRDVQVCGPTVTLLFFRPCAPKAAGLSRLAENFSQWKNRLFCRIYRRITGPFTCTPDQILYLCDFLPFAFRRMLRLRRYRKR